MLILQYDKGELRNTFVNNSVTCKLIYWPLWDDSSHDSSHSQSDSHCWETSVFGSTGTGNAIPPMSPPKVPVYWDFNSLSQFGYILSSGKHTKAPTLLNTELYPVVFRCLFHPSISSCCLLRLYSMFWAPDNNFPALFTGRICSELFVACLRALIAIFGGMGFMFSRYNCSIWRKSNSTGYTAKESARNP